MSRPVPMPRRRIHIPRDKQGRLKPKAQYCITLPYSTASKLDAISHQMGRSLSQTVEYLVERQWERPEIKPEDAYAVLGPIERRGRPRVNRDPDDPSYLSLTDVRNAKASGKEKELEEEEVGG